MELNNVRQPGYFWILAWYIHVKITSELLVIVHYGIGIYVYQTCLWIPKSDL